MGEREIVQALETLEPAVRRYQQGDLEPRLRAVAQSALARALAVLSREPARVVSLLDGQRQLLASGQQMNRADVEAVDALVAPGK